MLYSKEIFVNEYRSVLADKLLSKEDYDTDREVHILELLKLRFGETSMHHCEIMIKDLATSRRVGRRARSSLSLSPPFRNVAPFTTCMFCCG